MHILQWPESAKYKKGYFSIYSVEATKQGIFLCSVALNYSVHATRMVYEQLRCCINGGCIQDKLLYSQYRVYAYIHIKQHVFQGFEWPNN